MPRPLKKLLSERRQYAGFMVGTVVAMALGDSTLMLIALGVHEWIWSLVIYALTVDIKVVRSMDDASDD
jgi:hypothetical protein